VTIRSSVADALRPVVGEERLKALRRTERRWRRSTARRLDPAASKPTKPAKAAKPAKPAKTAKARKPGRPGSAGSRYSMVAAPPLRFPAPTMTRHEFLTGLHRVLEPQAYLEVGVNDGRSLALARCRSIGVDPAFKVTSELRCDVQLARTTSDEFFARPDASAHLAGPIDLAFIDGMHLAEFAYRDLYNVEPLMAIGGVVLLDDMLPRDVPEAARDRYTNRWAGDVYKVAEALEALRPDLVVVPVNTSPTGVVLILGADPASTVLADAYPQRLAQLQAPDPQQVPERVLTRSGAADPAQLLADPVWARLTRLRRDGADLAAVREAIEPLRPAAAG
jgi:predicted O-methyltransferase YrrM